MTGGGPPLGGVRVVVTRPRRQARTLGEPLRAEGASVIYLPLIEIADPESWDRLDDALRGLDDGDYEWVAFASANAVARLFRRAEVLGLVPGTWSGTRVAAVGRATARALRDRGVEPDLIPATFTGRALARALGRGDGRVLLPRVEGGPGDIVAALRSLGWAPVEVTAYRNLPGRTDTPEGDDVRAGRFEVVTFASGSAARAFPAAIGAPDTLGLAPPDPPERLVACIGPSTARAAADAGFRIDVEAEEHTAGGLVRAIAASLAR